VWPVVFKIGNAALYSYTLFVSFAFFTGLLVWIQTGASKIGTKNIINATLLATLSGFLGARALFVLTQWQRFTNGELSLFRPWEGGIVFLGGFLAAICVLSVFFRIKNIESSFGFNSAAPAIAAAHAVGRLGCFFNGCCYGSHCDYFWAVHYTNPLSAAPLFEPLHPTQIYEFIGLLLISILLIGNLKKPIKWPLFGPRPNVQTYFYLYGFLRFVVETTRGDQLRGIYGPFSTSQWISLGLIFVALFLDFRSSKSHN
jgi:phosphatidylglycerol:prolipoprotein diacylglycerol transferase